MNIVDLFNIQRRFLRSAHLERDFHDPSALEGYVVTNQVKDTICRINAGLSRSSGQRSWRITGDYGTGKSSLALLLAQLYSRTETEIPSEVRAVLEEPLSQIRTAGVRFLPVLVTGSREPLAAALVRSLARSVNNGFVSSKRVRASLSKHLPVSHKSGAVTDQRAMDCIGAVHSELVRTGEAGGLLIVLDELGKFLEFALLHPERQDVFLLQQLAELATGSKAEEPLFLVGLLHQGFSAYSEALSQSGQREWEKVAGRFEELLFDQPLDQIAHLVATALGISKARLPRDTDSRSKTAMRDAIGLGWYGSSAPKSSLTQAAPLLYPLHPTVMPVLLKLFSRWGQNERSLFSFLLSNEPSGLLAFSQQKASADRYYHIHHLYDYVATSLGHRLSTQSYRSHWNHISSLIRSFPHENAVDQAVLKTVGLLNLLNSPELIATEDSLILAVSNHADLQAADVRQALRRLHKERHVLYLRGRAGGYCLWSHTSINLDLVYEQASRSAMPNQRVASRISSFLDSRPIVARRHYIQTGNLRCFDIVYCDLSELESEANAELNGADGRIIIPLCETPEELIVARKFARAFTDRPDTLIGLTEPLASLNGLVNELERWTWMQNNTPELKDDRYAAEEVTRQLTLAGQTLENRIQHYVGVRLSSRRSKMSVEWYGEGRPCGITTGTAFQSFLSDLCDRLYSKAPRIQNELVNRRAVSSSAAAARGRLIERILTNADEPQLGMDPSKKPPEMAIYMSILKAGRIHIETDGRSSIVVPSRRGDPCRLIPTFGHIAKVLQDASDSRVAIPALFSTLRARPFGIKDGLLPLILAIYLRTNWHRTALYEDGTYLHDVGGIDFMRLVKEPEHFELQHCAIEGVRAEVYSRLVETLRFPVDAGSAPDILDVVRPLMKFVAQLPDYSRATRTVSARAVAVRTALLDAREPSTLLFRVLPEACGCAAFNVSGKRTAHNVKEVAAFAKSLRKALGELQNSYGRLIDRLGVTVIGAFGSDGPLEKLRQDLYSRCARIKTQVTDSALKAFAFRLADSALTLRQWLESLGSLLVSRPPERWGDQDETEFAHQLTVCVGRMVRLETILFKAGAPPAQKACHLVMTRPDGTEVERVFEWEDSDNGQASDLEQQLTGLIEKHGQLGVALAARAIWKAIQE